MIHQSYKVDLNSYSLDLEIRGYFEVKSIKRFQLSTVFTEYNIYALIVRPVVVN